jgi:phosphate transport system substrate-binding protein
MNKSLTLALLATSFLVAPTAHADSLSVHGSTTFVAAIMDQHKEEIQKETGLTLDVVGNGSGNGLTDLALGKADVAMLSSNLKSVADKVNAKTPSTIDAAAFKAVEVAKTHVAFAVHPSNPVKELKTAQIVDILSGKITNWKEVGGPDKAILVATEIPTGGLRSEVEKGLLGGANIAANKRELVNASMISKIVAQMPEALGIMGAGSVTPAVHELKLDKSDVITLFYATKGDPSPAAKKLIDSTIKHVK